MVFQPVTPDRPDAQGANPSATNIGNAIHWLDLGANGQAMQAINRAIDSANGGSPPPRAWSGYSASSQPANSQPYALGYSLNNNGQ
jgi:hypothetical protein